MAFQNPFEYPSAAAAPASAENADSAADAAHAAHRILPFRQPGVARLSLFGEILDWMLVPLLIIWPLSFAMTYLAAQTLSGKPYDRALEDQVEAVARQLEFRRGSVMVDLPPAARNLLRADEVDEVYFQVLGARGELASGEADFPLPPEGELLTGVLPPGTTYFRDDVMRGQAIRVAYRYFTFSGVTDAQPALVQVGETRGKREALANEFITGVILPQFLIVPIAVLLVWFGLSRGIAPLDALRERISRRKADDLSPVDPRAVPEEVRPVIVSINSLMQRVRASMKGQQRFVADAAHQMRTPLAGLKMQAELALRQTDPVELKKSLDALVLSTSRATHMVNQLLSLTRAESPIGKLAESQALDLRSLVQSVLAAMHPRAQAKQIDLGLEDRTVDETSTPATIDINGNPVLLGELFTNLVDNAIRYTPKGGQVTARLKLQPGSSARAVVEIEDTGMGIAPDEREAVFERFYRGREVNDAALGNPADGSGLGLAIVREIAAKHRARVLIETPQSGNNAANMPGTLFRVIFPMPTGNPDRRLTELPSR